ncbi:MAG: hypothetical protein F7B06_07910 [Opitutae bacterium]|nr:hypothetical protein [Opitutae bacterium]
MRVYQFHHLGIHKKPAIAHFNRTFAKSKNGEAPEAASPLLLCALYDLCG